MSSDKDTKKEPITREQFADMFYCNPDGVFVTKSPGQIFKEVVAPMQQELEQLKDALTKIDEIRNSIIGLQTINWSEHIYPLVAALEKAGIKGREYPANRENFGTMLERTNKAEARVAQLEGLLRKIELLCISSNTDHDIIKKINVITSALSGTEEKQKPNL